MAILPQIDNSISNGLEPSQFQLPSKTYRLNDSVLTTRVEEGEPTIITNDPPIEITDKLGKQEASIDIPDGKSKQATRDGKNIINIYDKLQVAGGYTVDSDDWITLNADRTSESTTGYLNYFINSNLDLKPNTNYYFVLEIKNVLSQLETSSFSVVSTTDTSWKGQFASNWGLTFNELNNGDIKIQRINTRSDFSDCVTFSRMFIGVRAGDKVSITFRLSVVEEQPTAETFEYEPYGISPSPTYPSDIKNVGSDVNLFELNNTKYPIDTDSTISHTFENETVTLNGSLTSKKDTYLIGKNSTTNYICTLKPNTTYTILIEIVSGSFTGAHQWILRADGTRNYQVGTLFQPDYYDNKSIKTFTTGDTEVNIMSVLLYNNDANVSYTNLKFRIKLVEGSDMSTYTFYNQSSININVETKNKFTGWVKQCFINSSNGVRSYSATGMTSKLFEIKPNTNYRISGIAKENYNKNKFITYYRADKSYISRTGSSNVAAITFTTPENARYCALGIAGAFADTTDMDNFIADSANIQLEEGTTTTSYQKYGKQEITFPLVNGQRLHEGDYLAEDGIHQVRKTLVLDGTENWGVANTAGGSSLKRNSLQLTDIKTTTETTDVGNIYSNYYKAESSYRTYQRNVGISYYNKDNSGIFIYDDTYNTTANDFKTWLASLYSAGNPLTVEYELKEEIVIPYTAAQQEAYNKLQNILLYKDYTEIDCIDEIKPTIKVTYFTNEDIHFVSEETDRIEGYVDGINAIKQAIYHILMTERYAYLIYDNNYGVELNQYIGKDLDYIEATIEQTLKEALTHDLRITDVKVNSINQIEHDKVLINFTAYTIYGDLVLEVNINV